MNIIISEVIRDRYLTPFKITEKQVNDTVINEDIKKTINLQDYIIIFFLKKIDSYYILVDGRWKPSSSSLLISAVFIIDEQLIKNIFIDNPLAVLEQFAKEFGYDIEIGDQISKFIHDARIEIPFVNTMNDFTKVLYDKIKLSDNESYDIGAYVGDMIVGAEELGGKLYAVISLAYFINTDKYTQYLKSNHFI